jgi:hypothetical protein
MSEQAERQDVLMNETYFRRAQLGLDDDQPGGRFRAKETISGSEQAVEYPRLPASSSWAGDPVPPEEPLGLDVNAMEPCGTPVEIERSLASLAGDLALTALGTSTVAAVETASANPTMKRRKL